MNLSTVKWAQWDKTQSRDLLVCSYVCASHCAKSLHTILHRTDLIVFPLTLQTITTSPMMSIWGKGHPCKFHRVSRLGSVNARHCSSGRQPNFAALIRGRHLYSAERPSRWALAHISNLTLRYRSSDRNRRREAGSSTLPVPCAAESMSVLERSNADSTTIVRRAQICHTLFAVLIIVAALQHVAESISITC